VHVASTAFVDSWGDVLYLDEPAVSVPTGWASTTSWSFHSPDRSVTVTAVQRSSPHRRSVAELASAHAAEVTAAGGALAESLSDAIALAGRKVGLQSFTAHHPDTGHLRIRAVYHVTRGVETVVTTVVSSENETAIRQAEDILREFDPWARLTKSRAATQPTTLGRFSNDELLTAARLIGIAASPMITTSTASSSDSTMSGLIARGVVRPDIVNMTNDTTGDDLVLDPALERALRTLVSPATVVSIESGPPGRTTGSVVYCDDILLVSVRPLRHGVLQVDTDRRDQLGAHLHRHLALRQIPAVDAEPALVDGIALERTRAGTPTRDTATRVLAFAERIMRVRSLISTPGAVSGADITIVDGGDDGYWLAEPTDAKVSAPVFWCRPISSDEISELVAAFTQPHTTETS
jgi:hypothetical protein